MPGEDLSHRRRREEAPPCAGMRGGLPLEFFGWNMYREVLGL